MAAGCESTEIQQRVEGDTGRDTPLGFPVLATKNTTRVPGEDPVQDAAAVATAVYPGFAEAQRPQAVTLVDRDHWQAGIAASVLMAPPVKAPILLTDGEDVPDITAGAIERVKPRGAPLAARAQAFRIGNAGAPDSLRSLPVRGRRPVRAGGGDRQLRFRITGTRSANVIVASGSDPRFAMPAAGWAAKSGDAVLFTARDSLPGADPPGDRAARRPVIYVLGPPSVISERVVKRARPARADAAHRRRGTGPERDRLRPLLGRRLRLGPARPGPRPGDREQRPPARRRRRGGARRPAARTGPCC